MTTRSQRITGLSLLLAACMSACPAYSAVFTVRNRPPAQIQLTIGGGGSHISAVRFNVQPGELGNGTPIQGNPPIRVVIANRATPNYSRTAVLSVDSSTPLTNGAATLPFTAFSWTSRDGDVPAGRFDGSNNQFLLSFPNSFSIRDSHRFFYDNTAILEAGSYTGRVIYTLSMP